MISQINVNFANTLRSLRQEKAFATLYELVEIFIALGNALGFEVTEYEYYAQKYAKASPSTSDWENSKLKIYIQQLKDELESICGKDITIKAFPHLEMLSATQKSLLFPINTYNSLKSLTEQYSLDGRPSGKTKTTTKTTKTTRTTNLAINKPQERSDEKLKETKQVSDTSSPSKKTFKSGDPDLMRILDDLEKV